MRKMNLLLALFLLLFNGLDAQNIKIMPVSTSNMSASAASMLYGRLNQAAQLNGLMPSDNSNRFLLVTSVNVLSVEATSTVPVKYVADVEIMVSMVDNYRRIILSQEVLTKKGVGANTTKSVGEAIKSLKSRDAKLKRMIVAGKEKIFDYYSNECDSVFETVNAYLEKEMYDVVVDELNAVPQMEIESDCYRNLMDVWNKIPAEQKSASNSSARKITLDVSWVNE